jgi:hypothetical protein
MKGAFNLHPSQPRHAGGWDVKQVLDFLKRKEPTDDLSMKDLTLKLSMLLALSNAFSLYAFNVRYVSLTPANQPDQTDILHVPPFMHPSKMRQFAR